MTVRICVVISLLAAACGREPPPVKPAPPLPADPAVKLESMQIECDSFVAALGAYKACPNLDDHEAEVIGAWMERATLDLAAGHKAEIEPNAQAQAAGACRRAADSVRAAHERCRNGRRPKGDY
ncbi:MAG: hypothetical protein KF773_20130 [Deltaproteobacteria bacterium]|nr:hypothetical protein [Deltaproteobacteria bacterium]MCW5805925.1 hypothetical protein [Deltaproteobacteria bacterium]